ncbi:hypothetical protein NADFUDRAFT_10516, partial [Nadsonia fulvescens var. elongata DSM 6958]
IKAMGRFIRFPAYAGGAVVAGASYVSYKVQEVQSYTIDKVNIITDWLGKSFDEIAGGLDGFMGSFGDERSFSQPTPPSQETTPGNDNDRQTLEATRFLMGVLLAAIAEQPDAVPLNVESYPTTQRPPRPLTDDEIMDSIRAIVALNEKVDQIPGSIVIMPPLPTVIVVGAKEEDQREVIEALVGHEFLPRSPSSPINTVDASNIDLEFEVNSTLRTADFGQIQSTLHQIILNQPLRTAPVKLLIHSAHVPDLTLVDLPIVNIDAHNSLYDQYLRGYNLLLSVSSAKEPLLAPLCEQADPLGVRTIRVITQIDTLDPQNASKMLSTHKGSIGMVGTGSCKSNGHQPIGQIRATYEKRYLQDYGELFQNSIKDLTNTSPVAEVGLMALRHRLIHRIHRAMLDALPLTLDTINQQLEETSYEFKVNYNDQPLTAELYVAAALDSFKLEFQDFAAHFGRDQVRAIIKSELDQRILDLLAQRYWNKPDEANFVSNVSDIVPMTYLPQSSRDDPHWHHQLDTATSTLTKLGVGRLSTNLVITALMNEIDHLVARTPLANHPLARDAIHHTAAHTLNARYYATADQVENCIKPYKYEVEPDAREWTQARQHTYIVLKEELRQCEAALTRLKGTVGSAKLSQAMNTLDQRRRTLGSVGITAEPSEFSRALMSRARDGVFLRDRRDLLKMRMMAVKSPQCNNKDQKYYCPEVFLNAVADKLTKTAVLFLNVELLADFYHNFPSELDARLGPAGLSEKQLEDLAKEDPKVRAHIELQQRKVALESLADNISHIIS